MKPIVIIILFSISACLPSYKPHQVIIQDDFVEVQFGRVMPIGLLDSIAQAVSEKGIQLSYPNIKYDGSKLSKLQIQVIYGNYTGTGISNFVYKGRPFGFRVDKRPGAKIELVVGELE